METNPISPEINETKLLEVLASLNQISDAINHIGPGDMNNSGISLQLIVESAIRVVPGSSAVIYIYDQSTGRFEAESRVSAHAEGHALPANPVYTDDAPRPNGIGVRTIQRRRRTLSYEEHDIEAHPYYAASGVNAVGCFPLIVAEQTVGILYIYLYEKREFTKIEQLMLDNFVNQAAMAIYHARRLMGVHRDLARKEDELSRLHRAGLIISSRLRLKETLESILQLALEVTNARYGIFRLLDKSGEFLITSAVGGSHMDKPLIDKMPLNGNSVMAHVARTRQPVLIPDLRVEPWLQIYYPLDSGLKMLSELAVPLVNSSGRLEGVLNLESPHVGAFSEDDSHMLQSLSAYAITAIQEVRLLDALQGAAQLLISQPSSKVLDQLCVMASDLLNSSASAIWLDDEQGQLQLVSSNGEIQNKVLKMNLPNMLTLPLMTGDNAKALGMFGVVYPDMGGREARSANSEWDKKVLACLANYAVLAVQNESHQQALRTSQEQHWTAETFAAVGDISANLLHNMNNKVGIIPVRVQGIQDKYRQVLENDSYLTKSLNEIERSAMEAMQIVQENLSHLRPIRMEKIRIAVCVSDAIRSLQISPTLFVDVDGLDALPMVVAGGPSLAFVFKNLIENADAVMNGNGVINIRGQAGDKWVEISVIDNGPGIPPGLHNQIFELNFSARTGAQPGKLGFGLWWVKTLMTRLGGSVMVESDGQHGATFILRLPRAENSS
ncbi:GAF domain-containing protein [Candidatus Villigracilis saccharophilus]|uniref:GAF domain-containing sensor histidine kinase n=1 Tax=Candidatus Villigracilis saccharophilus TaxID=3140684 RepID=UPI0031373F72|nr:GAF domain-containing protein [Anaerolineales bacterium]